LTRIEEFRLLPGAAEGVARLNRNGFETFVATNQAAVAKGFLTPAELMRMHESLEKAVSDAGGSIRGIYHCPHREEDRCLCRKPKPGLLEMAFRDFPLINRKASCFIGDSDTDGAAARAAGIRFFHHSTNANLCMLLESPDFTGWMESIRA
jgi:D-glycero-D-manno-heptose 1,7-bisphosphate phosphatase